jgi:hypothetical protein
MPAARRPSDFTSAAAALCALLAACQTTPDLLPPPFGPDTSAPQPPRLFFPTGLAVHPASGHLLVVNGNFNHQYSGGTLVSIDPAYLKSFFTADPATATSTPAKIPDGTGATPSAFTSAVMIGNYGGPITLDPTGSIAYFGSRDSSTLDGVTIDSSGKLSCLYQPAGSIDCRPGIVNTREQYAIEAPYMLVNGYARLPGSPSSTPDQPVMFVNQLSPTVDLIDNGVIYSSTRVAALLPYSATSTGPSSYFVATVTAFEQDTSYSTKVRLAQGAGPAVFDYARRQLIQGGCYYRASTGSVGEPGTYKCSSLIEAYLRFIGIDEGNYAGVRFYDTVADTYSHDVEALALGNADTSQTPTLYNTLYVATRAPDLLAEYNFPSDPRLPVQLARTTPMPVSPAQLLVLKRPAGASGADLVLVSDEANGTVAVFDSSSGQVVAQVEQLGSSPWGMVQLADSDDGTKAQIAITIFQDCRIALMDVDYERPWLARVRGRLGSCPQ